MPESDEKSVGREAGAEQPRDQDVPDESGMRDTSVCCSTVGERFQQIHAGELYFSRTENLARACGTDHNCALSARELTWQIRKGARQAARQAEKTPQAQREPAARGSTAARSKASPKPIAAGTGRRAEDFSRAGRIMDRLADKNVIHKNAQRGHKAARGTIEAMGRG